MSEVTKDQLQNLVESIALLLDVSPAGSCDEIAGAMGRAVGRLRRYAQHLPDCARLATDGPRAPYPCNCGLSEIEPG
jgi:hypothetical protein